MCINHDVCISHICQETCIVSFFLCTFCRFSRKLIWLKLTPTNNDPKVICRFYLESVEECKGMYILYNFYTNMWADSRIMLQIVTEF